MISKRMHKWLCFLVAISMVWLPFAAPASEFSPNTDTANSAEQAVHCDDMARGIKSTMPASHDEKKTALSMDRCDSCKDNCACSDMPGCTHGSSHATPYVVFADLLPELLISSSLVVSFSTRYENQIIIPDFRPPII